MECLEPQQADDEDEALEDAGEDVGETSFEQVLQDKQNHRLKDYLS